MCAALGIGSQLQALRHYSATAQQPNSVSRRPASCGTRVEDLPKVTWQELRDLRIVSVARDAIERVWPGALA